MKYILVTGASSGIGEATARYLASQGYGTVLVARRTERLQALAQELGPAHYFFTYDLTDLEHVEDIFRFCTDHGFKLDGMVHSAGVIERCRTSVQNMSAALNTMSTNAMSFLALCKEMTKRKYSNDGASIVAISSLATRVSAAGTASYTMSKSALNAVCRVVAKESLKRRIRVNAVMPGDVATSMCVATSEISPDEQPFGTMPPIEVAYLVEFLLSDKSSYLTGAEIPLSGGMNF